MYVVIQRPITQCSIINVTPFTTVLQPQVIVHLSDNIKEDCIILIYILYLYDSTNLVKARNTR